MTVQALIHDLLHWIPKSDRTGALKDVLAARQELGDHESVRAIAAVLREREAAQYADAILRDRAARDAAAVSTTWTDGEGEG